MLLHVRVVVWLFYIQQPKLLEYTELGLISIL